jgi:hypothetical protein
VATRGSKWHHQSAKLNFIGSQLHLRRRKKNHIYGLRCHPEDGSSKLALGFDLLDEFRNNHPEGVKGIVTAGGNPWWTAHIQLAPV